MENELKLQRHFHKMAEQCRALCGREQFEEAQTAIAELEGALAEFKKQCAGVRDEVDVSELRTYCKDIQRNVNERQERERLNENC
jgi:hypothetical protein